MVSVRETEQAQRHFPTVKIGNDKIALAEYEAATRRCQADERAITITNGLLIAGLAAILPVIAPLIEALFTNGVFQQAADFALIVFLIAWAFVTSVISSYVCELRRAFVFSARKVIVIRRLLGQSYGQFALVLPIWRLEGADEPLSIKLFPGWSMISAYSLYATAFLSAGVAWLAALFALTEKPLFGTDPLIAAITIAALWAGYWLWSIRKKLYDAHETGMLSLARVLSKILFVRLQDNFHYTLYRAQLSRAEGQRLKINFDLIRPILVFREDRSFFHHRGIALKSMVRALWDWVRFKPSGGASTITQQLARSLFIVDMQKQLRRKVVEIILALWLEQVLQKNDIIETYITSVRYDKNVLGFLAARKHFFVNTKDELTKAEALVLIERVANIRSQFRTESVERMLKGLLANKIINLSDAEQALIIYDNLLDRGIIKADGKGTPELIRNRLNLVDTPKVLKTITLN